MFNFVFANAMSFATVDPFVWFKNTISSLSGSFSNIAFALGIIVLIMGGICFTGIFGPRARQKASQYFVGGVVCILLGGLANGIGGYLKDQSHNDNGMKSSATITAQPSMNAAKGISNMVNLPR